MTQVSHPLKADNPLKKRLISRLIKGNAAHAPWCAYPGRKNSRGRLFHMLFLIFSPLKGTGITSSMAYVKTLRESPLRE
jgi:hypothetical protein